MKDVITVRGLTMGFGGRTIMENLDFDVRAGEVFVILGGSGSGKRGPGRGESDRASPKRKR